MGAYAKFSERLGGLIVEGAYIRGGFYMELYSKYMSDGRLVQYNIVSLLRISTPKRCLRLVHCVPSSHSFHSSPSVRILKMSILFV